MTNPSARINLTEIINKAYKYHYITVNNVGKLISHKSSANKLDKILKTPNKLILIKLKTLVKNIYEKEKKSLFKITGGPLYAEINTYSIINDTIKKDKSKHKNKVYFPKKYLSKKLKKYTDFKWMKTDIIKIANAYINNTLNQQILAINNITNI